MVFELQMEISQMQTSTTPPTLPLSKSIEQTSVIFDGLGAPIIRAILWLG